MNGSIGAVWSRKRVTRRRLMAAGGAGLTAAMLACSSRSGSTSTSSSTQPSAQSSSGAAQPGGTINWYLNFNPMLDPHKQSSVATQGSGGVMQRLTRYKTGTDPQVGLDHTVEMDLAQSVESPDAITFTIKLKPDVKFHNVAPVNGHPFEAEDVKSSFLRILDPATSSPNRGAMGMIDPNQIQMPDKNTIVFKLNYAYSPFRSILASPAYSMIFPREAYAGAYDPAKVSIGTGPYMLDSATPDVAYIYKKNPNYWEKGQPNADQVKVAIITDDSAQLAQFTAKNLDVLSVAINNLPTAMQGSPQATHLKIATAGPSPIYFQLGDPTSAFQDIRLRQAVSMAIDRDAIAKAFYGGDGISVVFVPAYSGKWAVKVNDLPADTQKYYKYDPAEAKKLLDASGNSGKAFKFVRLTNGPFNSAVGVQRAEAVNNMLQQVGLKTTIVIQDYFKDFVATGKGSRQGYFDKDMMCYFEASAYNDPDEWLFSYFHSKSTSNQEHLNDPKYDALVDKQRAAPNEDERLKAVQDIQKYLAQMVYAPSTIGGYTHILVNPRLQNYQYSQTSSQIEETYAKAWVKQ